MSSEPGFGVYVHWPFCAQKCPYCDFNSHVRFGGWDEDRFLAAYLRELSTFAHRIKDGRNDRRVTSIFFGGGTPSLMKPETVGAILTHIGALWPVAPDAEITLEANPNSVEAGRFRGFRDAGVNRVSIGVQSLRDEELKKLGRIHSVAEAKAAVGVGLRTFDRVSFDLIYARPGQTVEAWREELSEALAMGSKHLSLYQLTIEPETPFADLYARGKLKIPAAEAAHDLFETTQEMCALAGLPAYEISNHARPGEESRHNLLYWRYGEYVGVGAGAHGRIITASGREATSTVRAPERWVALVEERGEGLAEIETLGRSEMADEMLLMGLRLGEGLDLERLSALTGFAPSHARIAELMELGLLAEVKEEPADFDGIRQCLGPGLASDVSLQPRATMSRIKATGAGRFILNELVLRLSQSFVEASVG